MYYTPRQTFSQNVLLPIGFIHFDQKSLPKTVLLYIDFPTICTQRGETALQKTQNTRKNYFTSDNFLE